ncbi:tubulin epsilon and delta complex protein 2 isoform X2 [Phyllopteryx taeniolatus]|uniref:tubulin epsilon and delta complex protein 2 isoform X2 n=1 Tax=Phyllopteryx taeniolatus TaxID=161469 RepID=UPI002AD502A6|nr:tubulin epsilon and delta complex protein 2 isoform X2 [Phyllopteryx taeniolatus]
MPGSVEAPVSKPLCKIKSVKILGKKCSRKRSNKSNMSLLTAVETAIKSCKEERVRVNGRIHFYRELLQSLAAPDEPETTNDAPTDTATSNPVEMEEMKLLEQALQKALYVRTGTRLSSQVPEGNKPTQLRKDLGAIPKQATSKASSAFKGNQTASRSTLKSAGSDKKVPKKPGTSLKSSATCGPGKCKSTVGKYVNTTDLRSTHRQASKSVQHTASVSTSARSSSPHGEDLTRVAAAASPHAGDTADDTLPQPRRLRSEQRAQWISLRLKQNRMWDKAMAAQRKPAPGRSRFMERVRATDWPRGSPEQIGSLVGRLNRRADELAQQCQTMDLLDQQTPELGAEPGMKENRCSCLTPERLQITAVELQRVAERAKQEWEAWDRWRPEGGCLYAAGPAEDEAIARHLPVTVTYTSEAELRQLEAIRMRLALLRQEIYLQQALLDALSPQLASIVPSCPDRSVLRDVYSLLGEGGQRFPAIILESEPE